MSIIPRRLTEATHAEDLIVRRVHGRHRAPARVERAVDTAVAVEHGRGLVQAARVRALEYVSTEAMLAIGNLTELETLYLRRSPLGEARYRAIADTAAVAFATIVADTGRS